MAVETTLVLVKPDGVRRALCGEIPFDAKVPLVPRLRVAGNDRNEEDAVLDLPADFRVPFVAVLEPAFDIEPHFDAARVQRFRDAPRGLRVLGRVREEHRAFRRGTLNAQL